MVVEVYETDCFGVGYNVLVAKTPVLSEEELEKQWKDYRNLLLHKYQTEVIDEFKRWNFYLFYVVDDKYKINRTLKHNVEHDTISSRKIIVNADEAVNFQTLIGHYIKYSIQQHHDKMDMESYHPNPNLKDIYDKNED